MPVENTFNPENPYGSASTIIEGTPQNPDTKNDPILVQGKDTTTVTAPMETPKPANPAADLADAQAAQAAAALQAAAAAAPKAPVDGQSPTPDAPAQGALPAGGVEKFFNKETGAYNWEAHARESEFRLAQKGTRQAPAAAPVKGAPPIADSAAQQAVANAGLDWNNLGDTLLAKGELQDSDYTALDAAGIPREIVDNYVDALSSVGTLAREAAEVYIGGGKDANTNAVASQELMDWAANNLTDTEVTEHNRILQTSNWRISVDALLTSRANAGAGPQRGAEPQPMRGQNAVAPVAGEGAFKDFKAQMNAQMDPRYATDEGYRQGVIRRIAMGG